MTAEELLAQARAERDAANVQREREWHRANEAERARDAALAERDQARAERDDAQLESALARDQMLSSERARDAALVERDQARAERDEQAARAEYLLMDRDTTEVLRVEMRDQRAAAVARAEARRAMYVDTRAALDKATDELRQLREQYGKAIAALEDIEQTWQRRDLSDADMFHEIRFIVYGALADPSATAAVEAMRAQQDVLFAADMLEQYIEEPAGWCGPAQALVTAVQRWRKLDARRGGK